jgi:pimeloyl-ACP methyl ester carboxylesterase
MRALALLLASGLLSLGLAVAPPAYLDDEVPTARAQQKLVEEYLLLDEWTPEGRARRADILVELEAVPALKKSTLKSWTKRIEKRWKKAPELEKDAGTHYLYPDAEVRQERGKYVIGGERKSPRGLLIAMHGGGVGSGDAEPMAEWYDGPAKERKLLMIAPEVLEKTERGWTDSGTEEFVLQLIQRGLKTWDIDPNRVYLSGHSMGGYGSWAIGAHHADWCAGLAPSAGGPTPIRNMNGEWYDIVEGFVPNLRNVRLVIYQSADDPQVEPFANRLGVKRLEKAKKRWGGYDYEYWEVDGRGHGAPPGGYEALLDKIVDSDRNLWPERVVWQPVLTWDSDFYWLRWDEPKRNAIVMATVDREHNRIDLDTSGGSSRGMGFWLDPRLVDLDAPVVVVSAGETLFEAKVQARLATLLESAGRRDPEYLTAYAIRLRE